MIENCWQWNLYWMYDNVLEMYEIAVKGIGMRCDGDEGYKVYSNID